MSANLALMLKTAVQHALESGPILDINPHHCLLMKLRKKRPRVRTSTTGSSCCSAMRRCAEVGHLDNPPAFVKRINALLEAGA